MGSLALSSSAVFERVNPFPENGFFILDAPINMQTHNSS